MAEDIQTDIEISQPKHDQKDKKGPEFPSINNDDQEMLATRKTKKLLKFPILVLTLILSSGISNGNLEIAI